ncbi:hypothetical protein HELRODRAFT_184202 [Helobdella robusta]|uniref:Uncharacterized protein n=1 Tax=Helobdella robusta TaxID=6412 RepID=T1FKR4_HELRO|nr:hypothetical protein HELRODRAFT_184202 [Helobdella robusta]ESO05446.1 hypothetical protein HELRODRAFT_184202 [Helobdella robusta]
MFTACLYVLHKRIQPRILRRMQGLLVMLICIMVKVPGIDDAVSGFECKEIPAITCKRCGALIHVCLNSPHLPEIPRFSSFGDIGDDFQNFKVIDFFAEFRLLEYHILHGIFNIFPFMVGWGCISH